MASERIPDPLDPRLQGVGQALHRAYAPAGHDAEEQAERHALRKIEIREALK